MWVGGGVSCTIRNGQEDSEPTGQVELLVFAIVLLFGWEKEMNLRWFLGLGRCGILVERVTGLT